MADVADEILEQPNIRASIDQLLERYPKASRLNPYAEIRRVLVWALETGEPPYKAGQDAIKWMRSIIRFAAARSASVGRDEKRSALRDRRFRIASGVWVWTGEILINAETGKYWRLYSDRAWAVRAVFTILFYAKMIAEGPTTTSELTERLGNDGSSCHSLIRKLRRWLEENGIALRIKTVGHCGYLLCEECEGEA